MKKKIKITNTKKNKKTLTINQVISKLQTIKKKHGNMPIYFDSEAGKFNFHYVHIHGVWHMKKDWSATGEQHVYFSTHDPIIHERDWMIQNIKINFAMMVNRTSFKDLKNIKTIKSRWQLGFLELPIEDKKLPLQHKSDRKFFEKYWKLDKRTYEKFMKDYFPGWKVM